MGPCLVRPPELQWRKNIFSRLSIWYPCKSLFCCFLLIVCTSNFLFVVLQVGSSQSRFLEIQGELKRLQAISPCGDPPEAEGQSARWYSSDSYWVSISNGNVAYQSFRVGTFSTVSWYSLVCSMFVNRWTLVKRAALLNFVANWEQGRVYWSKLLHYILNLTEMHIFLHRIYPVTYFSFYLINLTTVT